MMRFRLALKTETGLQASDLDHQFERRGVARRPRLQQRPALLTMRFKISMRRRAWGGP